MPSDLYGFKTGDIPGRRAELEAVFAAPMEPHESSYLGEYDLLRLDSGARLRLQANRDAEDGSALAEDDFPEHSLLIYVESKDQADELREQLLDRVSGIEFLRREMVTADRRFLRIRSIGGKDVVVFEKRLDAAPAAVHAR